MESTGTLQGLCDHIWQYQQICRCYISSGTIFQWEFNGDVCCVIRVTIYGNTGKYAGVIYHLEPFFNGDVHCVIGVTIYGNTGKYAGVIYHLEPFFNGNSMVMSVV